MSIWKTFPIDVPNDGVIVWVRVLYYYSEPFQATWDLTTQSFVSVLNSIVYPAWSIARWRPL